MEIYMNCISSGVASGFALYSIYSLLGYVFYQLIKLFKI